MTTREILHLCTLALRKGERVTVERGRVEITHVYAMPSEEEVTNLDEFALYDLHFIKIAVHKREAERLRDEFLARCREKEELLKVGPSYIALGAELGSQDAALAFIALGSHYGLWGIITPQSFGAEGEQADELAGKGMVLAGGFAAPL